MEPDNNNQASTAAPATGDPVAPVVPPSAPTSTPVASSEVVKTPAQGGGKDKKKILLSVVLLIIILIIVGALGYYAYSTMMKPKPVAQTPASDSAIAPVVSVAPTQNPNSITDDSQLEAVVKDLDSASDEASMNQEVNSLKSDSNF